MKTTELLIVVACVIFFNIFGLRTDSGRAMVWTGHQVVELGNYVESIDHHHKPIVRFKPLDLPNWQSTGLQFNPALPLTLSGFSLSPRFQADFKADSVYQQPELGRFLQTKEGKAAESQAQQILSRITQGETD
jgi:hypothetical protein